MFSGLVEEKRRSRPCVFNKFSALGVFFTKGTECHHGFGGDLRRENQHREYLLFYSGQRALDPAGAAGEEIGAPCHISIVAYISD